MMNANSILRLWVSQRIVRGTPTDNIPIPELLQEYKKFVTDPIPDDWVIDNVAFGFADSEVKDSKIYGIKWRPQVQEQVQSNVTSNVPEPKPEPEPEPVGLHPESNVEECHATNLEDLKPGDWYTYCTSWGGPYVSKFVEIRGDVYTFSSTYYIKKEYLKSVIPYERKQAATAAAAEEVKA